MEIQNLVMIGKSQPIKLITRFVKFLRALRNGITRPLPIPAVADQNKNQ